MANIFPFRAIFYNQEKVHDLSLVTTPPYDVISEKEQDNYYKMHEYNIVRLILGKESREDGSDDSRYTRAAFFLKEWTDENVLVEDKDPCIYFYSQEYDLEGMRKLQKGFICILRLEEFSAKGGVLPHEQTLPGPKKDRLKLISACHANLAPIFGLYSDPEFRLEKVFKETMGKPPFMNAEDANGTIHKLWRVHDSLSTRTIGALLRPQNIYMADGHHRYEAALSYRENRQKIEGNFTGEESYNHIMIYLTNMDDDGLTILPAHRVVRSLPVDDSVWEKKLDEFFIRRSCSSYEEMSKLLKDSLGKSNTFGLYRTKSFELLILKDTGKLDEVTVGELSGVNKSLDVAVAHNLILNHVINNGKKMAEGNLSYVKDARQALKLVDEGKFALAILLNPTRVEQVKAIASAGMRMPGKATYFYPKPLSGLVLNKL